MESVVLPSAADGEENYAMHLSGMGSLMTSRPPKICDVCSVVKADLYCAADDAYLCPACDIEVHSANSLAQRHERVKLGPNGAPMKIERKGGSAESQRVASSKKADSTMVSVLSANSGSSMSGSKKKKKGKRSSRSSACNVTPLESKASGAAVESKPKGGPDRGHNPSYNARLSAPSSDRSSHGVKLEQCSDFPEDCMNLRNFLDAEMVGDMDEDMDAMLRAMECCDSMNVMGFPSSHCLQSHDDDDFVMDFNEPLPHFSSSTEMDTSNTHLQSSSITTSHLDHSSVSTVLPTPSIDYMEQVNGYRSTDRDLCSFIKEEPQTEWEDAAWCAEPPKEALNFLEASSFPSYPSLQLNYEDVMTAWSEMGGQAWLSSPSPVSVPTDHEDSSTSEPRTFAHGFESNGVKYAGEETADVEDRCARVLRYREKRRNRLFCKTIRYEVRKLNAERRPRIKGRFVKRCDAETV